MKNKSKEIMSKKGFSYRDLAFILDITERQAMNILNKENKSLVNYLVLSMLVDEDLRNMFELDNEIIDKIKKRVDVLKSTR